MAYELAYPHLSHAHHPSGTLLHLEVETNFMYWSSSAVILTLIGLKAL